MRKLLTVIVVIGLFSAIFPVSVYAQTDLPCGAIVKGEITTQEADAGVFFTLDQDAGDEISLGVSPIGQTPRLMMELYDEANNRVVYIHARESERGQTIQINNFIIPASGAYKLKVIDWYRSPAAYTLTLGCVLAATGTVIQPGDTVFPQEPTPTPQPILPTFGFLGVSPVDFSEGIEIPLEKSKSETEGLGGDVALYTYSASAGETATLTVSRVSGDISIGVAVINKDTNELIFLGGMPSSDKLSVELTFPSDGVYAIGLFALDTAERIGTSGAVQLLLE